MSGLGIPEFPSAAEGAFYLEYGKAMAAWADLEHALSGWFRLALCPDNSKNDVNAEGIFYSARSFNGRIDMLKASLNTRNLSAEQRQFVRKAIKRASDYNKLRSKLAHRTTVHATGYGPERDGIFLREGDDWRGDKEHLPSISTEHLQNATIHFDALKWIILTVDLGISPGKGRQLIDRLPKEAHLPADNRLIEEIYEPQP